MKTRTPSMEETIGRRLYLMGLLSLVCAAAACIFVFHRAFTRQAWRGLENESAIIAPDPRPHPPHPHRAGRAGAV